MPFTNCDGYWYAERTFKIPAKATNALLKISRIGADDRIVVQLNGTAVISSGANNKGDGDMQFADPGSNVPHHFEFKSGPVRVSDSKHLQPGVNKIRIYVNNTFNGIYGMIMPVNSGDPSEFGIEAKVTYTVP